MHPYKTSSRAGCKELMVQVVCGRRGRYSQVKSKKEIMSATEGSISSLGIISPDLTRSYSFIILTVVSVPCPIFSPTSPKGTGAQCLYTVSLPMGLNLPQHSSSITEQWAEAAMEPLWCLGLDSWWHWSCPHLPPWSGQWQQLTQGKPKKSMPRAQGGSQCHYWCRWRLWLTFSCRSIFIKPWTLPTCFSTTGEMGQQELTPHADFLPGLYLHLVPSIVI